ncbi:hypothetical protein J2Z60_001972 [Lactobacillus colini]|uniref:Uncharacterized protein n=1 Tax=Lactobacillus colini TaxID=1819254 RepID=A0ABS4MGF7_9LACO|nr:hypothetical protein [Lactobacillus colini]MBP2058781.1 hypothetical protein [Lactobacillus colini]
MKKSTILFVGIIVIFSLASYGINWSTIRYHIPEIQNILSNIPFIK